MRQTPSDPATVGGRVLAVVRVGEEHLLDVAIEIAVRARGRLTVISSPVLPIGTAFTAGLSGLGFVSTQLLRRKALDQALERVPPEVPLVVIWCEGSVIGAIRSRMHTELPDVVLVSTRWQAARLKRLGLPRPTLAAPARRRHRSSIALQPAS